MFVELSVPVRAWAKVISKPKAAITEVIVLVNGTPVTMKGAAKSILWNPVQDERIPLKEQSLIEAFEDYLKYMGSIKAGGR